MPVLPRRLILALTLAASLPAALTGCTTTHHSTIGVERPSLDEASIAGPAIDISTLRGDIDLRIDPRVEEISVDSRVRVAHSGKHFDLDLMKASVDVTAEIQDRGGLPALVITTTSRREEQDYFVDLTIRVPAAEGLRIRSLGGRIRVAGIGGAIDIDNATGPIEIRTDETLTQPITVRTGEGNVYLQTTPKMTGKVRLTSSDGRTILEAREGDVLLENVYSKMSELTGVVNRGENPVTISTGDGTVRLLIIDEPMDRTRFRLDMP